MQSSAFWSFYHPHSQGVTEVSALKHCLLSVNKLPIILCGDFNLPNIDWFIVFPTVSTPVNSVFVTLSEVIVLLSWYQSLHVIIICWTYSLLTDLSLSPRCVLLIIFLPLIMMLFILH